jgi:DNA-binding MarR family transcriptional regulator/N-acetylglutamate synthase-like GNAT family acetyltransferase
MTTLDLSHNVAAVRRFNRFYTRQIGVLEETLLSSTFSLTEARVMYELAHHESTTATELSNELGVDAGYLSRILRSFAKRGLIDKRPSVTDGRQTILHLTDQGQAMFAGLNAASHSQIEAMLAGLSDDEQQRLNDALRTVERLLGTQAAQPAPFILRPPQPGDMGWVVQRHGALYAQEYGWDEQFEALVAEIVAKYVQHYDPARERCWIAEQNGQNVGSVFLVRQSDSIAKLRLLLVEPRARGLGIGNRLVGECIGFARQAGYAKMTLWTQSVLLAARHIYRQAGFRLVQEGPHHSFGHDLTEEVWELDL